MKKIIILTAALAMGFAANAESYLYWMVNDSVDLSKFTYDTVKISGGGSYLNIYDDYGKIGQSVGEEVVSSYSSSVNEGLYAAIGSSTVGSFIIELWNDNELVAQSFKTVGNIGEGTYWSYAQIAEMGAITQGGIGTQATVWAPTLYAVPEPNSALLMLLGLAAMALKRRKLA